MNKNAKRLAALKAAAIRAGETSVTVKVPVANYHSNGTYSREKSLQPKTYHFCSGSGVVSNNRRRNMQMAVLVNKGEDGRKDSRTVHEPMIKDAPVTFKGHGYIRDDETKEASYFQPMFKAAKVAKPEQNAQVKEARANKSR